MTHGSSPTVEFTPEQQDKLDEIVREAMGRAGKPYRKRCTYLECQDEALRQRLSKYEECEI
jgi:hypothetical protein